MTKEKRTTGPKQKKESIVCGTDSLFNDETKPGSSINNYSTQNEKMQENTDKSVELDTGSQYEDTARNQYFAFLVYPESAPDNWLSLLSQTHVRAIVSPLHDKDVNPDGVLKKPHYHVMLHFDSLKSVKQFENIRDKVGGVGREQVASARGYARYLVHLDNPEKAQYERSEIKELNGAEWDLLVARTSDDDKMLNDIMEYIEDTGVIYYHELINYCRTDRPEWFKLLSHKFTYFIKNYLQSITYAKDRMLRDESYEKERLRRIERFDERSDSDE